MSGIPRREASAASTSRALASVAAAGCRPGRIEANACLTVANGSDAAMTNATASILTALHRCRILLAALPPASASTARRNVNACGTLMASTCSPPMSGITEPL